MESEDLRSIRGRSAGVFSVGIVSGMWFICLRTDCTSFNATHAALSLLHEVQSSSTHMSTGLRIVLAGGAGFVGSHLCDYFLDRGDSVVVADNLITGAARNLAHL